MSKDHHWPFSVCPGCGSKNLNLLEAKKYLCRRCGFTYFHNVATGAGVLLLIQGKLLLLQRGKDPGKGLYTIPGGFVDPGESAEEAVVRECMEEAGIALKQEELCYLTSHTNSYQYKGIPYITCDIFFSAELNYASPVIDMVESTAVSLQKPDDIRPEILAFQSTRFALKKLVDTIK